ncbi:MAG TPA: hypothetical protein VFA93_02595 [Patescibacteria group bacterium]|nr:hypothetical protein [Patescibacteria group bacterium]
MAAESPRFYRPTAISPAEALRRQRISDTLKIVLNTPKEKLKRKKSFSLIRADHISEGLRRFYDAHPDYKKVQGERLRKFNFSTNPELLAKANEKHRGIHLSEKAKRRMSKSLKGRKLSTEHKQAMSRYWTGREKPPQDVAKRARSIGLRWNEGSIYRIRALPGKALWVHLVKTGLIRRIANHNYLSQSEIERLENFFNNFKVGMKVPQELKPLYARMRQAAVKLS